MSFGKLIGCRTAKLWTEFIDSNIIRNKTWILSANTVRFYSCENANKYKNGKMGAGQSDILGRFVPQTTVNTVEVQELKKKQESLERLDNSERETTWRWMKIGYALFGGALAVMGACLVTKMGAPKRSDDGKIIEDEFMKSPVVIQYVQRTWKELTLYEKRVKEPSRKKLLPDPLPAPFQPAYTVVIEFTDVLAHPDWSYQNGWRFKKRPGVDAFLKQVANSDYEIVVFTKETMWTIHHVLDKLDPESEFIAYKLFRDSTHFTNGVHVKDLAGLNRDLSKVIVVDWNEQASMFQPENSLMVKKWDGADEDTTLSDLGNLLEVISMLNTSDVREVLAYYRQFEDPIAAFRDNQQLLLERMEEQKREPENANTLTSQWILSLTRH